MDDLHDHGWSTEMVAYLDGMRLDEMKSTLGNVTMSWGLEEFEEVRQEAKRQRRLLDVEDRKFAKKPSGIQKREGVDYGARSCRSFRPSTWSSSTTWEELLTSGCVAQPLCPADGCRERSGAEVKAGGAGAG